MGSTEAGRLLAYLHWDHEDLAKAMVQAEDDIEDLKLEMEEVMRDRDRYHRESRESAGILGGILRVLEEKGMFLEGLGPVIREGLLPDDAPALREAAARPRRFVREVAPGRSHGFSREDDLGALCACGNQWLVQAERCVTQPVGL